MRILSILILTLVVARPGQVSGKKAPKGPKGGPCGKPFLKQVNGKCYYVGIKKMNWFGAQNNCLRKDLNLADLSTPEDYEAVVHYLRAQVGPDDFWLGGNDLQLEGRFTYISTGQVVRFIGGNAMVEPTHRSNMDDCMELRIRNNLTVVLDVNCLEKKYFICEKPKLKCARPTEDDDDTGGKTHSHEHLHHFHHDAAKKEKQERAKEAEEVESDSRPLDNSNSTEIGVSKEAEGGTGGPGEETTKGEGEGDGGSDEDEESTTAGTNSTDSAGTDSTGPAGTGSTEPTGTAGAEGAQPGGTGDGATTTAGDATTIAPAKPEGEAPAAPPGDTPATPPADGETPAPAPA